MQKPNNPKGETAAALIKGAVAGVPFVGGIISEVGNLYLNPLEKRKQRWNDEVNLALEEINKRFSRLPESLESDEKFISMLYQATILALKNHQKEKIDALRKAIISAANPKSIIEDKQFLFLRYVDDLTVTHMKILFCLDKHSGQISRLENLEKVYYKLQNLIKLDIDRTMFRSIIHDLDSMFLIRIGDIEDLPEFASKTAFVISEESSKRQLGVSKLGREFIDFIYHSDNNKNHKTSMI